MNFSFLEPWHIFLPREAGHVVALCGSGGKTTLLREVVAVWSAEGLPVAATTTTRSEPLAGFAALGPQDEPIAATTPVFCHGGERADGKWEGLSAAAVDRLEDRLPQRRVVVEVDGAAKLPCKYYRAGEPVWPERTSLAIVVLGVGAVGERAGAVVHRLGRPDAIDPVGVSGDGVWQWDHAFALLTGPGGYLDQVPPHIPVVLALGGVEQQPDSVGLFAFVARAMAHPRLPLVLFCSLQADGVQLRAACRDEVGDDADDR